MGGVFIRRIIFDLIAVFAIISLYLWVEPPIFIVAQLPPFPDEVKIVAKPGVSSFDVSIVRRAVCLTTRLLEDNYSLALGHDIEIILVPDAFSYSVTLQQDENLSRDVSLFQGSHSFGTTNNNHIIINVGGIAGYNDTLFVTAHELTHQYQIAEAGQWNRLNWLMEGMADMVAAQVVNENTVTHGENEVNKYRFSWLTALRSSHDKPNLKKLDSKHDWLLDFQNNGAVTYRTAGLAVLNLADSRESASFRTYMNALRDGVDAEQAFQSAFGVSCSAYNQQYEDWLANNL